MPDASARAQVLFEAEGGTAPTGWTETFYATGQTPEQLRDYLIDNYVPVRLDLMGIGARIQAVVAKNIPPNRISSIAFVTPPKGPPSRFFGNNGPDDFDPTQVDLLIRLETAGGKRRQFWMAGLPDSVTDQLLNQGIHDASFLSSQAFVRWVKVVTGGVLSIRFKTANGPPPVFGSAIITKATAIMVRNRKRGRPFFLFRGRRLA